MMLDQSLTFVSPNGAAQSMVGAAGVAIPLNNVLDILGTGVGTPPAVVIGNRALFGQDMGLGVWKPEIEINIGAAFVTGTSATANFSVEVAPDTGAAGSYQPGTWEIAAETGPKPASELTAGQVLRMAMPPAPPNTLTPRFYRMVMNVPAATDFTAGTVSGAFIVQGRDDLQSARQATSNYSVR